MSFTQKENLNRHVQTIHEDNTQFKCSMCDKNFKRKDKLVSHIKEVHEKGKEKVACPKCDKIVYKRNLKVE